MSAARAVCPAKINLGLRVLSRRTDGYHDLVTLFQAIDLEDVLEAELADRLSLVCDDPAIPTGETNLVLRAAQALRRFRPEAATRGARLRLRKAIPAGGGLGGGSSDAAGAILLLDDLWGLGLGPEDRVRTASEVGSDVGFFLTGGTALGTGRGDVVRPLRTIPERDVVLGIPPFPLVTAAVYARLAPPLTPPDATVTLPRLFVKFAEDNDFALATNDLETPAFAMRSELATFRDALLRAGAAPALLSGSGSTVFGLFGGPDAAGAAAASLAAGFAGWRVVRTRTVGWGARIERSGSLR